MTHPTTITAEPGLPVVDIMREFDAPAAAVFRAYTDPRLFVQWRGPRSNPMDSVEINAAPGGRWKYAFSGDGDMEFAFCGVYTQLEPSTLLIQTFEFNLAPGQVGVRLDAIQRARRPHPTRRSRGVPVARGARCRGRQWHGIRHPRRLRAPRRVC